MTLNIGIIAPDLTMRHGWAQYSLSLVKALHQADVKMTVVAARNSTQVEGVPVQAILPSIVPREPSFTVKMMRQMQYVQRLLRDCDVIHVLAEPYAPLGSVIAGRRPLLVTAHGSYVNIGEQERWPLSSVYQRALMQSTLVCVSHYTAKIAHELFPDIQTVVVNNGVDADRFAHIEHNIISDQTIILAVGALKKRKGQLELVRAMPQVLEQFPSAQCILIGSLTNEPDYVESVQEAIAAHNLNEHVQLLGHVPEEKLLDYYRRATLFVLPSMNDGWKFEGYGLVHMEASAAGLPVIGTKDCGAEDAIDDGVTGLLVSQVEIEKELPAAMIRMLRNPDLAASMGVAGRLKAQRQTWATVAREMIALYNSQLGT